MSSWPKQVTSQTLDTVQKSCNIVGHYKSLWQARLYHWFCLNNTKKWPKIAPSAKTNYAQCNFHYVYNKAGDTNSTKGCNEPILHWTYPENNNVQTVQWHQVFLSWWWFNHIFVLLDWKMLHIFVSAPVRYVSLRVSYTCNISWHEENKQTYKEHKTVYSQLQRFSKINLSPLLNFHHWLLKKLPRELNFRLQRPQTQTNNPAKSMTEWRPAAANSETV